MAQETPSRDLDKVIVRLPDGMREMLRVQAEHNKRSVNAEIVARLLESLEPWRPGEEPYAQVVNRTSLGPINFTIEDIALRLERVEAALTGSKPAPPRGTSDRSGTE